MNMLRRIRQAFTLVELLVVITIIAILIGLLFPAISAVKKAANKAKAQVEIKAIESGIKAYLHEYGKMPAPSGAAATLYEPASSTALCVSNDSRRVIMILTGIDTTNNPRRMVFLEPQSTNYDGTYLDPWDSQYLMKLDMNYDNIISYYGNLQLPAIVVSYGPDGIQGSPSIATNDDVVSFK